MSKEEFEIKVFEKLRQYLPNKSEKELKKAIKEYSDIVNDGYTGHNDIERGIDYAAWNISLCL